MKAFLQQNVTLSQRFCEFLLFNNLPSALSVAKLVLMLRNETEKWIVRFKPEVMKELVTHIVESVKCRLAGGREQLQTEEIKQFVSYLWTLVRKHLPGLESGVVDQLLIIALESFLL